MKLITHIRLWLEAILVAAVLLAALVVAILAVLFAFYRYAEIIGALIALAAAAPLVYDIKRRIQDYRSRGSQ